MLTFVQDNASLFGDNFSLLQGIHKQKISASILSSAYIGTGYNNIFEFHYKKGYSIEDVERWKSTQDGVGIATFENSDGKKFALRLDLLPSSSAKFGREKFKEKFGKAIPRVSVPYSEEVYNRSIDIEHIVGCLLLRHNRVTDSLVFLVIVEIVPCAQKVFEITENIVFQMGQILNKTHQAGVIHAHPHLKNWVLVDGNPRLLDGKGVLLDYDFPWHTCTGRVHTFQDMASNDCAHILRGELGTIKNNFDAFNDGYKST